MSIIGEMYEEEIWEHRNDLKIFLEKLEHLKKNLGLDGSLIIQEIINEYKKHFRIE